MFVVPAVNSEFSVLCQKVDPKHSEGDRVLPAAVPADALPREEDCTVPTADRGPGERLQALRS